MKVGGKSALCLAAFGCAIAAQAVVTDARNPYHPIIERNVFGLKDPPPPKDETPPPPPPAKITLTGITDVLGRKLALLEYIEPAGSGQPAGKKNYATLAEGQREGQIEVLEIDVKGGIVKVKNYGVSETLTFKDNGAKLPATPYTPPPTATGGIPSPTANIPPAPPFPGGVTTIGNANPASPGVKAIPSRQLRLPASAQPQPTVTEQELLLEVEAAVGQQNPKSVNPRYPPPPPPPPTSLNPTRNLATPQ